MKKIIYLFSLPLLMIACGGEEEAAAETTEEVEETVEVTEKDGDEEDLLAVNDIDPRTYGGEKNENQSFIDEISLAKVSHPDNIQGSYVGAFGPNMINITLYEFKDGKAEGYSVCAGNFRKISGTFDLMEDDHYIFDMSEPGDDQYDGRFEFTLDASDEKIEGKWTPFKKEGNSNREYKLKKRRYNYDNSVGQYPEASQRLLEDEDVMNLSEDQLSEMRNEIYARHGYSFKNKEWRYHFEDKEWYMPMGVDIRDKLSDVEVENIELIYEYESYFEDYYDAYGR